MRKPRNGYTLIEVLIVCAIISAIVCIAAPAIEMKVNRMNFVENIGLNPPQTGDTGERDIMAPVVKNRLAELSARCKEAEAAEKLASASPALNEKEVAVRLQNLHTARDRRRDACLAYNRGANSAEYFGFETKK